MDHLYAPWRDEYIKTKQTECVFCDISNASQKDSEHFVLYRDEKLFIVMNKFPYTVGHFMVIPHIHADAIESLSEGVWIHMSKCVQRGVAMLKNEFGAKGVNIGMNLGQVAGAGIAPHVHYHLVPRYMGDTNFITTIGQSRVYSTDFTAVYEKYKKAAQSYFLESL